jgi:hypothetical protein
MLQHKVKELSQQTETKYRPRDIDSGQGIRAEEAA